MKRLFFGALSSALGGGLLALLSAPAAVAAPLPSGCAGSDFVSLGGSGQSGVGACGVGLRMVLVGYDGDCSAGAGSSCQATPCSADLLIYYQSACPASITYGISFPGSPIPGGDGTIGSLPAKQKYTLAAPRISISLPDGVSVECRGVITANSSMAFAWTDAECTPCTSGAP